MSGYLERKNQAVLTSIPEADTMRTIIATAIAVLTAFVLINTADIAPEKVQPQSQATHNSEQAKLAVAVEKSAEQAPEANTETPAPVQQKLAPQPVQAAPAPATCAGELAKYDWPQYVATKVMNQESSGDPATHNDTPSTGDYSIGCYQINILGAANYADKMRLAQAAGYTGDPGNMDAFVLWLKDPTNNVAVAYKLWARAGGWGDWKLTCQKVGCS